MLNYYQLLCKNGHYWTEEEKYISKDICEEYPYWYNLVDFKKFCRKIYKCKKISCIGCKNNKAKTVILKEKEFERCSYCNSRLQKIYEIPKKHGKLIKKRQLRKRTK